MIKVLHLTQTDIRNDSRILKEMKSAYDNDYAVYGIGIENDENKNYEFLPNFSF